MCHGRGDMVRDRGACDGCKSVRGHAAGLQATAQAKAPHRQGRHTLTLGAGVRLMRPSPCPSSIASAPANGY